VNNLICRSFVIEQVVPRLPDNRGIPSPGLAIGGSACFRDALAAFDFSGYAPRTAGHASGDPRKPRLTHNVGPAERCTAQWLTPRKGSTVGES
jgi:hypothetical protein